MGIKIALTGFSGSGKDTIAEIMREVLAEHDKNIFRLSFGDGMKQAFFNLFPHISPDPKPTADFVKFGTAMREIDSKIWVKKLEERYHLTNLNNQTNFVITDLRNEDEYDWCVKNGFKIVLVICKDDIRNNRCAERGDREVLKNNIAETFISKMLLDDEIINQGSIQDLKHEVRKMLWRQGLS